jgi:FkbM family methyltransferase
MNKDAQFALSIHHIGGRGGTGRFPALQTFANDVVSVLYEADPSAIAEIQQYVSARGSRDIVIEACVGPNQKRTPFLKLWNPSASSYLPVSKAFRKHYPYMSEDVLDYDDSAWEVWHSIELETVSLDQLIQRDKRAPPPNFLSLNTQGSELEILQGATHVLQHHVLAIQTEFSFPDLYEGQAGIDDFIRFLSPLGFRIAKLFPHGTRGHGFYFNETAARTPIGLRGGGAVVQADALFIKEPQCILDHHTLPNLDLRKALFFGFIFDYFDYCYACAGAIKKLNDHGVTANPTTLSYTKFVDEYLQAIDKYPSIFPPVWTDLFASGTAQRFDSSTTRDHYFSSVRKEDFKSAVTMLTNRDYIGVELLALNYGLDNQAKILKFNRLASIWNNMRYLGLVDDKEGGALELHLERLD